MGVNSFCVLILMYCASLIPFLIKLSRRTLSTIKINTFFAITVKILFIALAIAGVSNLVMAIFADVGVTILVIMNSLRLLKFEKQL